MDPLKSFGVCRDSGIQRMGTLLEQGLSLALVDRRRGHVADTGMAMAVVVPGEEPARVNVRVASFMQPMTGYPWN